MHRRDVLALSLALLLPACGDGGGGGSDGGSGDGADARHYTYRALAGISMGAIGTGFIGTEVPGRFDALGPLGGALDLQYFLHFFEAQAFSGFCSYEDILAIL